VILLEDLGTAHDAAIVAERIVSAVGQPVRAAEHVVSTGASIGIAVFPDDAAEPETLIKCADLAMYEAKQRGAGGYDYFAQSMLASSREKTTVRTLLGTALSRGELELHYQPLVDVQSGEVAAMEALLRWNSAELGPISPLTFIPIAEQTGAITVIGEWVLRTACLQLAEWRRRGANGLVVCVNVSARQLANPGFVDVVLRAASEAGVEPAAVELELTESAALGDEGGSGDVLAHLARAGFRIAIDDFGSGYSSFQRIKALPIHTLKVDRSLVQSVARDSRDATIFSTIVGMAHALGLNVVAEGVETEEVLRALRDLEWRRDVDPRCDRVQGYVFSRPMPVSEATAYLQDRRANDSSPDPRYQITSSPGTVQ
jgi:EAL domain-containing protein (putative c-di-GMP-specific phosphodiesterase class I)